MQNKSEFRYKKNFGQHFLKDKNIVAKIVKAAEIKTNERVWEIGPGHGILTDELLKNTKYLTCFEIDKTLYEYLENKYDDAINLVKSDILKVNWEEFLNKDYTYKIVSNLPYQITSPFLFKLITHKDYFKKIVIMIQKDVAERLRAKPNTKKYGLLAIKIGYYFDIKYEFTVKPHLFYPPPKVDSAVISLIPKPPLFQIKDYKLFWKIVDTLFLNRRKMIRNNLKNLIDNEKFRELEYKTGISLTNRAENLLLEDFYKIYLFMKNLL